MSGHSELVARLQKWADGLERPTDELEKLDSPVSGMRLAIADLRQAANLLSARPAAEPGLFRQGAFQLHGGQESDWKIDCDALTSQDWDTLALIAYRLLAPFGRVEGIGTGGKSFAHSLRQFVSTGHPVLIADDVLTTGSSFESHRAGRRAIGVVAFARGPCPSWITPIFQLARPAAEPGLRAAAQRFVDEFTTASEVRLPEYLFRRINDLRAALATPEEPNL